ncbi:hypothetical protein B4U79_18892 [Dinothrombium tinctorium]|uniref:Uncharacterized protein n=1 Tax=Dinothrombium tinctorium TaxID=1965070 RepID=A0A3S3PDC8_9ACAR|nr:hypothetical protein B4U79_18892 [Dinothrombium tinctorium]
MEIQILKDIENDALTLLSEVNYLSLSSLPHIKSIVRSINDIILKLNEKINIVNKAIASDSNTSPLENTNCSKSINDSPAISPMPVSNESDLRCAAILHDHNFGCLSIPYTHSPESYLGSLSPSVMSLHSISSPTAHSFSPNLIQEAPEYTIYTSESFSGNEFDLLSLSSSDTEPDFSTVSRDNIPKTSERDRLLILKLISVGKSVAEVSRLTNFSRNTIYKWAKRFEDTGLLNRIKGSGFNRCTNTEEDEQIISFCRAHPTGRCRLN